MVISPLDNVEIREGGHKYALRDIAEGENVVKYGMPIGHATGLIRKGEHVHVHNVKTNLGDVLEYRYEPEFAEVVRQSAPTIRAYRHPDGRIGIRNDLWVIPLVEDVLDYGEGVKAHGLSLMTGPGNDLVASTVLAAAGCHLILFTTGRGTPFGCVVPTMKIATNDTLAADNPNNRTIEQYIREVEDALPAGRLRLLSSLRQVPREHDGRLRGNRASL